MAGSENRRGRDCDGEHREAALGLPDGGRVQCPGPPESAPLDQNGGEIGPLPRLSKKTPVFTFLLAAMSPRITLRRWSAHPEECPEVAPEGRYQALGP